MIQAQNDFLKVSHHSHQSATFFIQLILDHWFYMNVFLYQLVNMKSLPDLIF